MVDRSEITVRSYSVAPGVRGSPRLSILTPQARKAYTEKTLLTSFMRCAVDAVTPFVVHIVSRETPTGGKYDVFERVDENEDKG